MFLNFLNEPLAAVVTPFYVHQLLIKVFLKIKVNYKIPISLAKLSSNVDFLTVGVLF
jgi:hypothetical protein